MNNYTVVDHPLVQHKLTMMRDKNTGCHMFRTLMHEVSMLMCYEVTRNLPMTTVKIETPLSPMESPILSGKKLVLASILRAGNGFLEGMLALVPNAKVAHIGIYRDHETLEAVNYYYKAPGNMSERLVIVVDPMLGTGNSAVAGLNKVREDGAKNIIYVCLLAVERGIKNINEHHPDVHIYTAAIDDGLNDIGYLLPGIGDAGDRIYGTK